ncbi:MAG: TRAP transporter large permease [Desulfarculaceae bacterium]|nr:TRAP transporter large permease [Desulfarculaceae bacterium]MCF8071963.1 TRAP transporter large permease [Desulfarculaceae bacterium]MCF8101480.1 TRAP transporter large permease [Desulfarculaceae bacterium]MCF8115030.1 TRAP transporter large permease [Desulfarculaceae bacterium]
MVGLIFSTFFPMMIIGVPVAFCLALTTIFVYYQMGDPRMYMQIPQKMVASMENPLLLAIPFFIMTGEVMNRANITDKLMNMASAMVGFMRGGLAHTNIVASMLFAGITGSAVSDTVAIGSIMIPAMKKQGYGETYSAAVTASSSVIGPIIPPSIPMLIYASVMNVSIAGLFLGGMVPGILVGLALMAAAYIVAVRKGYGERVPFIGFAKLLLAMAKGVPALLMPVIIMGGILGGFFSPTQASAIAVLYGLFVGFVFYRTLKFKDLGPILKHTVKSTAMLMFLLACAKSFSWLVTYYNLVEHVAAMFMAITSDKLLFLLIVNAILLIVGMFLDMGFAIIVLGPLMAPVAYQMGVDPIHFGLIMCTNLTIGLATPPFGLVLFAVCGISKTTLTKVSIGIMPFLLAEVAVLLLVTYVPAITMFFPRFFGFAN